MDATHEVQVMGGILTLMAYLWITESVHLSLTALLPIVLFPLLGVMDIREVAPQYMSKIIFLFIGGFLIAFAIEKVNLHKRMALWIILKLGTNQFKFLIGFMLSSYLLSMWILNTTTVILLLPALLSILKEMKTEGGNNRFAEACLLGLAYAANVGGTATLIGTAPNLVFADFMESNFHQSISFFDWFVFAAPLSLLVFGLILFVLWWVYFKGQINESLSIDQFKAQYNALGMMGKDEKVVLIAFFTSVALWMFRANIVIDDFVLYGWSNLFPNPKFISDGVVAMFIAFVLFLIPSQKEKENILTWKEMEKMPFDVLLLFGGGFALAKGVMQSGLSDLIAQSFNVFAGIEMIVIVLILCLFMTFFTELTSNTASTQLVLPIVASLATVNGLDSVMLCLPIVFSASMAFMLPVATPPNTIVYGSQLLPIKSMVRVGVVLNIMMAVVVTLAVYFWGAKVLI